MFSSRSLFHAAASVCLLAGALPAVGQSVPQPAGGGGGGTFDPSKPMTAEADTSVLARAKADPRLTRLVALVEASGQASMLQSENVTLLAPSNEAFDRLPKGDLDRLLGEAGSSDLKELVRAHVLFQTVASSQLSAGQRQRTFGGRRLLVGRDGAGKPTVGGARIVQADITASNGVIHIIDTVLVPPARTLLGVIEADPRLTKFTEMLKATGRDATLNGGQTLTVLAPSDSAFARLSPAVLADLMDPDKRTELNKFVQRHLVGGALYSENIEAFGTGRTRLPSMSGEPLTIEINRGALINKTARIVEPNVEARNGVVHVMDDFLRFIPWGENAKPVPDQPVPNQPVPNQPVPGGAAPGVAPTPATPAAPAAPAGDEPASVSPRPAPGGAGESKRSR